MPQKGLIRLSRLLSFMWHHNYTTVKKIIIRALTGTVYVAFIVLSIVLNEWTFLAMCLILPVAGMIEFYRLTNTSGENRLTLAVDVIGGILLVLSCASVAVFSTDTPWCLFRVPVVVYFLPYLLYLIIRPILQLYTHENTPLSNIAYSYMGQTYIALPFGLMFFLYYILASPSAILAMFIMIWANDTGAYLIGSWIGRHRLFERISPKKSWEGFWGGMAFTIIAAILCELIYPTCFNGMTLAQIAGLAVAVSIFATWGDLAESLIKRTLKVKDSGNIMPGHGGILDRIDSLLLVCPATVCYMIILLIFGC